MTRHTRRSNNHDPHEIQEVPRNVAPRQLTVPVPARGQGLDALRTDPARGRVQVALHIFRPAGYEHTFQDLPEETQEAFSKGKRSTITVAIELTSQLTGCRTQ